MAERILPKIGTGVWVRKNGKVLLGKRTSSVGRNTWCPPGGHMEMNEPMLDCAIRETREEAGIEIENIRLLTALDNIWKEAGSHYVTLYFTADWKFGNPVAQVAEMDEWDWFSWDALPYPLFRPVEIFVGAGFNPFL